MGLTRILPVELTDVEVQQKATNLAEKVEEIATTKALAKNAAANFKDRLDDLAADASRLSREIRSRTEDRAVDCEESPDYRRGMMDIVRCDTGAVVDSRQLTYEERQQELPTVAPRAKGGMRGSTGDAPAPKQAG